MHGETLKFETLIMSLLAANGGTVTAISVEIFRLTFVTKSGFFLKMLCLTETALWI